ncbi:alkylhydroperoxide reductase/thiol specific antioxidant/malallergen [Haloferula helveola]|uniref:Alkylhydroperoxide reductase/thiol specific antioxidant/malallergen n=1 Tax=Haloferula helveola TaxID=490095 RepID=A0ABM7R9N6_9BACT|nr:alkylhydroperoxide reductase/thiol specific antioxidant/malallergen [Haloferula helveola]
MSRLLIAFLCPGLLLAEPEAIEPGHSHQGESFNEGPRQASGLIGGTGEVTLPIRTQWDQGQAYFDQGLGQLHGFWYYEAERSFRQLAAKDPDCAMAYWGMAMANWENEERAKGFINKAVELVEHASPHGQAYIRAQANYLDGKPDDDKKRRQELLNDLESLVHDYPDDIEAKAFLACRIWQFSYKGAILPIHSHEAVDALLQQVLAKAPLHPSHHYRIHLWDKRKAERAIDSAAKLGFTAPEIAHMWHMPGHIYSKLQRFEDAAWHQQASARVDHAHMHEQRLLPDQIFNYAHNNEWLARNWVNLGNGPAALEMAKSLLANPRHPKLNSMDGKAHSYRFGRMRLIEILEKFELWEDALELSRGEWLEPLEVPEHEIPRLRLIGLAHFHLGDEPALGETLAQLDDLSARAENDHEKAQAEANAKAEEEKKKPEEIEKLVKEAGKQPGQQINRIKKVREELEGCMAELDGDTEAALKALAKSGRPKHATALRHLVLGENEKADELSKAAVSGDKREALPLAARAEVLHALGRPEELRECFERLRDVSSQIDPEAPPFARMAPIAKALGFPADWTRPYEAPADFGERPDIDTLGPIHWEPPVAPSFTLPDESGLPVSLESHRGKPLILIFYLGHGCLHCSEQLNAVADRIADFKDAGLPVLAVSTDTIVELSKSQANYSEDGGSFPFPLIADPSLTSFRAYGTHDDFEGKALHGTFLLDPKGRILWSDIAADPFMDLDFLIKESHRLLRLHAD